MTETSTAAPRPLLSPDGADAPTGIIASFRYAFSSPARIRIEILAGLAVSLALIPEAIAFSILAGVDPAMGLFSSVVMAIAIAFTGGRPAMTTGATGAIALVIAPVARGYGMDYFIATVLLGGVLQIVLGALGVAKLQRFIPRSVMLGFVNALGIMIFTAQLEHLIDVPWMVYPLVGLGVVIMIFFPKLTSVIPAPAGHDYRAHRFGHCRRFDCPDGLGHGQDAGDLTVPVYSERAVDVGDPADHRALCPGHGRGRSHGIVDDRQARR